jgi:outer membrane lipase/esterase
LIFLYLGVSQRLVKLSHKFLEFPMTVLSLRRTLVGAVCASALLLAGCGSSSVESQLVPSRVIGFGDSFSVVTSGASYTVNDGVANPTWLQQMAASFGLTATSNASGGTVYAQGQARVAATPDAAGNSSTLTITQQIDSFLASNTLATNDVVTISGGISDVVAETAAVLAGSQTEAQMLANVNQIAISFAAQVRRLVTAGGKHVVVVNMYDLSISPWATANSKGTLLTTATRTFNDRVKVAIADLDTTNAVLLVDAEYYLNLMHGTPTSYGGMTNATSIACTSTDSGAGIGTGTGQVNSALCTTSTIAAITANSAGTTYNLYMFADRLYLTPVAQRLLGVYVHDKVHARW